MTLNNKEQTTGAIISFFAIVLLLVYIVLLTFGFLSEIFLLSAFAGILFTSLSICIFFFRKYRKANNSLMIDYLNVETQRHILGVFMIFYGMPKLLGNFFDYQLFALDSKLVDVSEFQLAWYYFGKNKWLELFSGIMEFVPGVLLLNRRYFYIAALVLLPVAGQVFILNFFFKIGGITFPAATILLACNLYILYSQKEKIIQFFKSLDFTQHPEQDKPLLAMKIVRYVFIALALLIVTKQIKPLFLKSDQEKKYQELVGVYSLEEMKKNNNEYKPVNESRFYKDLYIEKQNRWNMLRNFNNETEAFIIKINTKNDSISLFINKGGAGDDPDIIDYTTALKGVYKLDNDILTISGVQLNDTLQLKYKHRSPMPKKWFW